MSTMVTATCIAEYMALSLAVKELLWIYMLLKTIGINVEKPCVVYEDNRACIKIANNSSVMKCSKHIDIRHHFLRELIEQGLIKLTPVSTQEQLADVMTKILGRASFEKFRDIVTSDIDLTSIDNRTCAHCTTVFKKSRNKLFAHFFDSIQTS